MSTLGGGALESLGSEIKQLKNEMTSEKQKKSELKQLKDKLGFWRGVTIGLILVDIVALIVYSHIL